MENFIFYSIILMWLVITVVVIVQIMILRQFGEVYLKDKESISRDGLAIGEKVPKFTLKSIKGHSINRDDLLHKPTLITFISPNCSACKNMLDDWNKAVVKYQHKINFLLVSTGKIEENKQLIEKHKIKSDLFIDEEKALFRKFECRVTPFAFMTYGGEVREKGLNNGKEHIERYISSLDYEFVDLNREKA